MTTDPLILLYLESDENRPSYFDFIWSRMKTDPQILILSGVEMKTDPQILILSGVEMKTDPQILILSGVGREQTDKF